MQDQEPTPLTFFIGLAMAGGCVSTGLDGKWLACAVFGCAAAFLLWACYDARKRGVL